MMFKRCILLLMISMLTLSFVACNSTNSEDEVISSEEKSSVSTDYVEETSGSTTEAETEPETEAVTNVNYTSSDVRSLLDEYYTAFYVDKNFDTYYKLLYPEHIQEGMARHFADTTGVSYENFDLRDYVETKYNENWDLIHGLFPDTSYEIIGCIVGDSDSESQSAIDSYYEGVQAGSVNELEEKALSINSSYTGIDVGEINAVYVFAVKCPGFKELISAYEFNGNLFVGRSLDTKY